jgi:hypothetical protein
VVRLVDIYLLTGEEKLITRAAGVRSYLHETCNPSGKKSSPGEKNSPSENNLGRMQMSRMIEVQAVDPKQELVREDALGPG